MRSKHLIRAVEDLILQEAHVASGAIRQKAFIRVAQAAAVVVLHRELLSESDSEGEFNEFRGALPLLANWASSHLPLKEPEAAMFTSPVLPSKLLICSE